MVKLFAIEVQLNSIEKSQKCVWQLVVPDSIIEKKKTKLLRTKSTTQNARISFVL